MRLSALLVLLSLSSVAAAVPMELSHQGRLFDVSGAPLDGPHTLTLTLYDAPSGGNELWTENLIDLGFDQGYYGTTLGTVTPLDSALFNGDTLYLGLSVDGGLDLPQRLPLLSVPYAVRAAEADHAMAVSGGAVDATELRINGTLVADDQGLHLQPMAHQHDAADVSTGVLDVGRLPSHQHDAADLATGTVDLNRLPVGSSADTVARGLHTHGFGELADAATIGQLPVGTTADTVARGDHAHAFSSLTGSATIGQLPVGTTATEVARGDHAHAFSSLTGSATIGQLPVGTTATEVARGDHGHDLSALSGTLPSTALPDSALQHRTDDGGSPLRPAASCEALHASYPDLPTDLYWFDPDGVGLGEPAFQLACDMTTEGGGWIDLVASFQATPNPNKLLSRFFVTNGVAGTTISAGIGYEPTSKAVGFFINNSGYSAVHTRGFHLLSSIPYTATRLAYRMQGNQNDTGRCSNGNWVPLNGPGYNGGSTAYASPCLSGYSCIQGTCTNLRDEPIQASFSSDTIDSSNTLLTWSNSVSGAVSDACARDPEIPTNHPTVWFTQLLLR